ncbi:hypothetical protein WH87_01140 [Devosia epidermidihirudinis]|uniref:Lipoprotein n=1 Tax=Devosia epidermidihirudinis TaxID=1293439 RepID=A0A0F5QKJ5_9HYPH|nr:hypothetical protein [Devosia epidermidihirudinis]KKC41241.1 hypothetical protein WH87_00915 [Devosia epidermidihirudinis]KKC41283.1 hypothetical protein WH87_01140 [Devosia epidermidihirudinis]
MTQSTSLVLRLSALCGVAALLAGCSMGGMFGGGNSAAQTQSLQNATASPAAVAQAQSSALPAIATQCPPIKVRAGTEAMFYYGNGQTGNAKALQYQGVIDETSRNCVVSNGLITVNMGVVGRVLLGPAGSQSTVNAPIRFAVERDGQAVFSEKYTIPVAITPPAQSAEFVKVIDNVAIPYLGGETITIWVGFDTKG